MKALLTDHFARVFQDQTDLPVYRIGLEGYWSHTGWWGTRYCALSLPTFRFAFLAVELAKPQVYATVIDRQGELRIRQPLNQDPTDPNMYHGGGLCWSADGTRITADGLDGYLDFESGRIVPIAPEASSPRIVGSTCSLAIDLGQYDQVPKESEYGLFIEEGRTRRLVRSVTALRKHRRTLHPDWPELPNTPIDCNWPEWNHDGSRFFFEFGNHEACGLAADNPPRVNELWVGNRDLSDIHPVIPYQPDPRCFVNHGAFHFPGGKELTGATLEGVACSDLEGSRIEYHRTGAFGGHGTLSPNGEWIVSDAYCLKPYESVSKDFSRGALFLIHRSSGTVERLLVFPRQATRAPPWWENRHLNHGTGPWSVDAHPNWSADGRFITFNAMFGDVSQVCLLDLRRKTTSRNMCSGLVSYPKINNNMLRVRNRAKKPMQIR